MSLRSLPNDISLWKRYVDGTICFAKSNSTNHVIESLNGFHNNLKFTIQKEKDILLICNKILFNTTVYCKKTNTDLYIDCESFPSNNWKCRTLKTLVSRVYDICSTENYLKEELNHTETVFKHQNNKPLYPVLIKLLNKFNKLRKFHRKRQMKKKTIRRKYIDSRKDIIS